MSDRMYSHSNHQNDHDSSKLPKPSPKSNPVHDDIMELQQTIGNQAVQRLLAEGRLPMANGGIIQAKLTVGEPDDAYEQEADDVAQQVMTMPDVQKMGEMEEEDLLQGKMIQRIADDEEDELQLKPIQRMEEEEEMLQGKLLQRESMEEDEELQLKPADDIQRMGEMEEEEMLQGKLIQRQGAGVPEVTEDIESTINSKQGSGQSMSNESQDFFGSRMGQDFSNVNIHTGAEADTLNRQLNARAFTTGSDIFFRDGEYNPNSSSGQELLAHELTHVVQQGGSSELQRDEDAE